MYSFTQNLTSPSSEKLIKNTRSCDSLTVDVDAKGLHAGDENVNAEVKLTSADQVGKIHIPWRGLDGIEMRSPLCHQLICVSTWNVMG